MIPVFKILLIAILPLFSAGSAQAKAKPKADQGIESKKPALKKAAPDINHKALDAALHAYQCAAKKGLAKKPVLTVIDYSKPSTKPRLWTFDLSQNKLLFRSLVAHGKNSGGLNSVRFSDRPQSKQTSLGVFLTGKRYKGSHGEAMKLHGLDKGFNGKAYPRAIVMHGAHYASPDFIKKRGRLGLSWGCPAVPHKIAKPLIHKIKDGSIIFSYYPKKEYFKKSKFAKC